MDERKAHWDKVYDKNDMRQVSWYQVDAAPSLALIDKLHLAADAPVIDVGGGTSPLTAKLIERGMTDLAVLDIAGEALVRTDLEDDLVERVVRESGMESLYRKSKSEEDLERLENLEELISAAARATMPSAFGKCCASSCLLKGIGV